MNDTINRWFDRLQLSPRSQRVLTEATLDWQHEVTTASTFSTALWRHCRAAFGMCRALVLVVAGETASALSLSWAARLLFWIIAMTMVNMWGKSTLLELPHGLESYRLILLQTIVGSLISAPVLAIVTGPRAAKSPLVGYATVGFAINTALVSFAIPAAWQAYVDVAIMRTLPNIYGPQYPLMRMLGLPIFTLMFSGIADRLRSHPKRMMSVVATCTGIWSFFALRWLLDRLVHLFIDPNAWEQWRAVTRTLNAATMWLLPVWLLATWILLVRYQERLAQTGNRLAA